MHPEKKAAVFAALAALPNHWKTEVHLGDAVRAVLTAAGLIYLPEHAWSGKDRVDFLVLGDDLQPEFAIECKVKGSALAISRQLYRYAVHTGELVLVSAKATGIESGPITAKNGRTCLLHVFETWRNPI